ncbi:Cytochrome c553 [Shimia gijangensis]|uniref:Cytochrome c553 n=1 Tax=Shimia gijangensis TaxID=1470563 RepID=A0A1M6P1W0_9RHOB|nr:cytochrome c [Shimia gijangensis]SHK01852.1 Cytochrome c553 [Shimia gijangensis]
MRWVVGIAMAATVVWACGEAEIPDQEDGERIYEANCETCHGITGRGDGVIAASLTPRPADLSVLARRNGGTFPVSDVLSKIDGYTSNQDVRAVMPQFGAMFEGDLVPVETEDGVLTPTPRKLAALLAYLETIQR